MTAPVLTCHNSAPEWHPTRKKRCPRLPNTNPPLVLDSSCAPSWVLILPLHFSRYCVQCAHPSFLRRVIQNLGVASKKELAWMIAWNRRGEFPPASVTGTYRDP